MSKKKTGNCHKKHEVKQRPEDKVILLMGLPNVGKSALFSKLTGLSIMVSNYAGTTVEYSEGRVEIEGKSYILRDVPGTYDIQASNEAEKVAVDMLHKKPDAVVCVLDAINMESSLHLMMQVLKYNLPVIAVLNRYDLAKKRGTGIDYLKIQSELKVPVIPAVAITGEGLNAICHALHVLLNKTGGTKAPGVELDEQALWEKAEELVEKTVHESQTENEQPTNDFLVKPWPGIPIAFAILVAMFSVVIGLGMSLRKFLILPLFRGILFPWIENGVTALALPVWLSNVLIGEYGFLIKGIEWPFSLVLPYVISFYLVLSILEDCGYLPRLGVILDGIFNKVGLNGSCVIPLLLGYGCGIPAIMSTRSLPSRKQRIILSSMVCFAVPCVSQTGAFISLLSEKSIAAVFMVFIVSILAMIGVAAVLNKFSKGVLPETLMEVPQMLVPKPGILLKKILIRVRHYIIDGAVPMIVAVIVASLLYELGILAAAGNFLAPLVSGWLNMPKEAVVPLILGIVRRELTVLPLMDMDLTTLQFFTGAVIALFYVPCIAMIATMAKEFGIKVAVATLLFTTFSALFLGGLIAQIGGLLV